MAPGFAVACALIMYRLRTCNRAPRRWLGLAGALAVGLALGACSKPEPNKVGDVTLAFLMKGSKPIPEDAGDAPLVEILPEQTPTIPSDEVVQLAIDRKVSWGMVRAILSKMESQGQRPILLVAERDKTRSFHLEDRRDGPVIEVLTYPDGELCVKHPDVTDAKCVQTFTKDYIDAAYTRELVREAVKLSGRTNALVKLPQSLNWGDVVSAVGGARSCCKSPIRVQIKNVTY